MKAEWLSPDGRVRLINADCREALSSLPDASVDAVVSDPPYAEVDRDYGRLTECEWHDLMNVVVAECRRVLKPAGSAVFILQPNFERVGRMRTWLWKFMAKWGDEWGQVQDAWWWNVAAMPAAGATEWGLMRSSLKACVWLGAANCYRNQDAVLWGESESNAASRTAARLLNDDRLEYHPSGHHVRRLKITGRAAERGGVTPFNVLPIANTNSSNSGGADGHGAATPEQVAAWWIRYLCPIDGVVLDPFNGRGTVTQAAYELCRRSIGIERDAEYFRIAIRRIETELESTPLLDSLALTNQHHQQLFEGTT